MYGLVLGKCYFLFLFSILRNDELLRKRKLLYSIFDFELSREWLDEDLTSYLTLHSAFAFRNAGLGTAPLGMLHLVMLL